MPKEKKLNLFLTVFYIFTFLLIVYSLFISSRPSIEKPDSINKSDKIIQKKDDFGIIADSFIIKSGYIQKNETISSIFNKAGVEASTIFEIQNKFKDIFDLRKLITGKECRMYFSIDSSTCLKYFIYRENPVDYLVIDLNDTIDVFTGCREVSSKTKEVSGII